MIERVALMILFNALWLQLMIGVSAWLMLRALRGSSASTRYAVLCVALVAALVLPVAAALPHVNQPAGHDNAPAVTTIVAVQHDAALPSIPRTFPTTANITPQPSRSAWQLPRRDFTMPAGIVSAIFFAWLAMMLALLVRLGISFAHLERLKRDALPLTVDCRERLRRWRESMGSGVRLCVSTETRVPIAIGWFDAMVLIPQHLVEALDDEDLDRIVLHEMAHLRRRDAVMHVAQQLGSALYFFSPGLAWIVRQLDLEREVACDDWVVTERAEAAPYASCLVRLAEGTPWPHRALAAPGAFVTRRSMSIRIERILQRTRTVRLRPAPGPLAGTLVAMTALGALGVTVAPSIAYPNPPCNKVSSASLNLTRTMLTVKPVAQVSHASARPAEPNDYIGEMDAAIGEHLTVDELVAARSVGLTPATLQDLRSSFGELSFSDALALQAMHVDPQYRNALAAAGLQGLTIRQVLALKSLNVTPEFIAQANSLGFGRLDVRQLESLKSLGIDADYLQRIRNHGFQNLSLRQVIEIKASGVIK